jgi:N-acetylmuramoyl-L-alanine amidase
MKYRKEIYRFVMATAFLVCPRAGVSSALGQPNVIAIDPGHGGHSDSGSRALDQYNRSESSHSSVPAFNLVEGELTLELSKKIVAAIERQAAAREGKVKAVLTRTEDVNPNFTERVATAANAGAKLFVSIHFNSGGKSANGPVIVYQKKENNPAYAADRALATALLAAVQNTTNRFYPTPSAVQFDDKDEHFTNKNKPYGSYLFYQARRNPKTQNISVVYLEVEFLDTPRLERAKKLFVDNKAEVFDAWAESIAKVLVDKVQQ